jgi:hypothetical protein
MRKEIQGTLDTANSLVMKKEAKDLRAITNFAESLKLDPAAWSRVMDEKLRLDPRGKYDEEEVIISRLK